MKSKDLLRTIGAGAFAFALLASAPALAEIYEEWDDDGVAGLTSDEFIGGFDVAGVYDEWDADDDGVLSDDEFGEGFYDYYDLDDDQLLSADETDAFEDDAGDAGLLDL